MNMRQIKLLSVTFAFVVAMVATSFVTSYCENRAHAQRRWEFYLEATWDLVVLKSACQDYLFETGQLPGDVSELSPEYRERLDQGRLRTEHMSFECLMTKDGKVLSGGVLIIFDPEINYPIVDVIEGPVARTIGGQPR